MPRNLKKLTVQIVAGANIATIVLMLLVGYSDRVDPVDHPVIANFGLTFPFFLLANTAFLVFWAFFSIRRTIIPIVGFVMCYGPTRVYCPLNISRNAPDSTVKVMSYNVWMFASGHNPDGPAQITSYILRENPDILCMEECGVGEPHRSYVSSTLGRVYQYSDTSVMGAGFQDEIDIYTKYPILKKERIPYRSSKNHSVAFYLKMGLDTVVVVANHFESTGLSTEEKKSFKTMMKGELGGGEVKRESKRLIDKLAEASRTRAPQAEAVAGYVRRCKERGLSVILCGDFNDCPISYVRRTVARELNDCYVESATGPGISYHYNAFYVRIDNIMCSDDWVPYECKVDDSIKTSDHYPIVCKLKKRDNP